MLVFDIPVDPALLAVFALFLGLMVGSFLNVVIYRLPQMLNAGFHQDCECLDKPIDYEPAPLPRYNLAVPRSACPACKAPIAAYDNIPVVSWLLLKGRCRHCQAPISPRYPLIELGTGVLSALVVWHFGASSTGLIALPFLWILIALFWIDADVYMLPDSLTLGLLWLGLLVNLFGTFVPIRHAVIGAMAGYLILWLVSSGYKLIKKREGMAGGDLKLLAALGAWLGWQIMPVIILLSSLAGAIIGIGLIFVNRHEWGNRLPYGPYLTLAGLVAMLAGPAILQRMLLIGCC